MDAKSLSTKEVQDILRAVYQAQLNWQARLKGQAENKMGLEKKGQSQGETEAMDLYLEQVAHLTALRLTENRREVPLTSVEDFKKLVPSLVEKLDEGKSLGRDFVEKLEKFMTVFAENFAEIADLPWVSKNEDPYEKTWKVIQAILDLAAKHQLPPEEVPTVQSLNDEIVRTTTSKDEFAVRNKALVQKFWNPENFKKILLEPMVEFLSDSEDEKADTMEEIEAEWESEIGKFLQEYRDTATAILEAEITRIYG